MNGSREVHEELQEREKLKGGSFLEERGLRILDAGLIPLGGAAGRDTPRSEGEGRARCK